MLVPGGLCFGSTCDWPPPVAIAEVYDPATGTWSTTDSMAAERYRHTATLLPNGKVLVVGGGDIYGSSLVTAEVYTP